MRWSTDKRGRAPGERWKQYTSVLQQSRASEGNSLLASTLYIRQTVQKLETSSLTQLIRNNIVSFIFLPTECQNKSHIVSITSGLSVTAPRSTPIPPVAWGSLYHRWCHPSAGEQRRDHGDSSHCSSAIKFTERRPFATGNSPRALHNDDTHRTEAKEVC